MDLSNYAREVTKTLPDLGSDFLNQLHMVIGLATESGELLDAYKKALAYKKDLDIVNIKEELGDLFWYAVNLSNLLEIDLEAVLEKNIEKLRLRYPNGFTEESAINRNLSQERDLLESE